MNLKRKLRKDEIDKIMYQYEMILLTSNKSKPSDFFEKFMNEKNDYSVLEDADDFFLRMPTLISLLNEAKIKYNFLIESYNGEISYKKRSSLMCEVLAEIDVTEEDYSYLIDCDSLISEAKFDKTIQHHIVGQEIPNYSETDKNGYDYREYELKKAEARKILDQVDTVAKYMYDSVNLAVETAQSEEYELDIDLVNKIDNFLKLYAMIYADKYTLDGKVIDYKEDYIDYFSKVIDMAEEYGHFLDISELDELEELKHLYDGQVLFALYFKWKVTNDKSDLSLLIKFFLHYFEGSCIYQVDLEPYSNYTPIVDSDVEYCMLSDMVYVLKEYIDAYEPYISLLPDRMIEESPYKNKIPYSDYLAGRAGLVRGEVICRGCDVKFLVDLDANPEKYQNLINNDSLSKEEYLSLTRDLDEEEKEETGRFANAVLTNSIEAINILSHVLKDLCSDDKYILLYRELRIVMERIFSVLKMYSFDFYDFSDSESIEYKALEYKHMLLLEITNKLMVCFEDRDVDSLIQIKKEMMPLYRYDAPWMIEKFEENIYYVSEKIKKQIAMNSETDLVKSCILNTFSNYPGFKFIQDEILETLITAEFLYDSYIKDKEPISGFDYSFVSILYYQVLEKALNLLFYQPFIETIKYGPISGFKVKQLFGNAKCTNSIKGKIYPKDSIELGVCSFLLKELQSDPSENESEISRFIKHKYKNASINKLREMSDVIKTISTRRNNAAHPLVIDYSVAQEDKIIIYTGDETFSQTQKIRDVFIELLTSTF